jgi:translation initiation factor IF-1
MENRGHITSRMNNFVTILEEDFVLYRHVEFGK